MRKKYCIDDDKISYTSLPASVNFVLFTLVQGIKPGWKKIKKHCVDDDKIAYTTYPKAQILLVNTVEEHADEHKISYSALMEIANIELRKVKILV